MAYKATKSFCVFEHNNGFRIISEGQIVNSLDGNMAGLIKAGLLVKMDGENPVPVNSKKQQPAPQPEAEPEPKSETKKK